MYSKCPKLGKIAPNVIKHQIWYRDTQRYTNPYRERNYLVAVAQGLRSRHFQPPPLCLQKCFLMMLAILIKAGAHLCGVGGGGTTLPYFPFS